MKTGPRRYHEVALAALICCLMGCEGEATFQRQTATGGLVTFSIQSENDILSSAGRREALRIMQDKCPSGPRIVKEGEVPKVSKAADRAWGPQIGTDRKWGIQFTCK